jgi:isopenicillin-N N-acyltransferase-like protein
MTVRRFTTTETDPYARGLALGRFGSEQIAQNVASYSELFRVVGVDREDLPGLGRSGFERIAEWAPPLAEELRGQAEGAGLEVWELGLLNARTEILATVGAMGEGECSTSVHAPTTGPPRTLQTWDWHDVSNDETLVVSAPGSAGREVRYFTEFGILGKIGVNGSGLGVHFNILNHTDDGDGIGVPVHAVARAIIDRARTIDDAVAIARSASVSASTVLTVVSYRDGATRSACIELSSGGTSVVYPTDDFLLHTNHFLDGGLARGEMVPETSNTYPRLSHLEDRRVLLSSADPVSRTVGMLVHESDGAPVCCHADPALSFEHRWQTLLTIALDVEGTHLEFHEGGPCTVTRESWQVF